MGCKACGVGSVDHRKRQQAEPLPTHHKHPPSTLPVSLGPLDIAARQPHPHRHQRIALQHPQQPGRVPGDRPLELGPPHGQGLEQVGDGDGRPGLPRRGRLLREGAGAMCVFWGLSWDWRDVRRRVAFRSPHTQTNPQTHTHTNPHPHPPVVHQPHADGLGGSAGQHLKPARNLAERGQGLAAESEGGHGAQVGEAGDLAGVVLEGERLCVVLFWGLGLGMGGLMCVGGRERGMETDVFLHVPGSWPAPRPSRCR